MKYEQPTLTLTDALHKIITGCTRAHRAVNCCCCRIETNDDDAEMIYQGSGVAQYVCPDCKKLPFEVVMGRAEEDDSPAYIDDKLRDEVPGIS